MNPVVQARQAAKDAQASPKTAPPWWKFGFVWLVISGPAVVAVACAVTLWLALAYPETLVDQNYYRSGLEINKTLALQAQRDAARALLPAMQGRNHAATPAQAVPGGPPP